ncbi:hypothetical protein FN846DRAFT_984798, partial [Sphaerosporella brunnea]
CRISRIWRCPRQERHCPRIIARTPRRPPSSNIASAGRPRKCCAARNVVSGPVTDGTQGAMFLTHLSAPARMTRPPSLRCRLESLPRCRDSRLVSPGLVRPPSFSVSLAILEWSRQFSTCLDHSQSRLAVSCASLGGGMTESKWDWDEQVE